MKRPTSEEYEKTFERLTKSAAPELLNDPNFKKTTLIFLALGGETLARQHIQNYGRLFPEKLTIFDKPLEDEVLKEGADDQEEQGEDPEETESE